MHDPYDAEVYHLTLALLFQHSVVECAADVVRNSEQILDGCPDYSKEYAEQYRELCKAKRNLAADEAKLDGFLERLYELEEQDVNSAVY
jgi:hypothetical protein